MSKQWLLIYQDGPQGPKAVFSYHRKREAAERAREKALRDPYWQLFSLTIEEDNNGRDEQ